MDALTEIHEYNTALRLGGRDSEVTPPTVVVSAGTGCVPVKEVCAWKYYKQFEL